MGIFFSILKIFRRGSPRREVPLKPRIVERNATISGERPAVKSAGQVIQGRCYVIDGDTISINKTRIRLARIDAPELDHPYGQKSKWALVSLCKGQTISAHVEEGMSYDRLVATCRLPDGRDLSAELVRQGLALDWKRFSDGKYRNLEPRDARKRLWKTANKQYGRPTNR